MEGRVQQLAASLRVSRLLDSDSQPQVADFLVSVYIAIAFLVVRVVLERLCVPVLRAILRTLKPGIEGKAEDAFDDAFIGEHAPLCLVFVRVLMQPGVEPHASSVHLTEAACSRSPHMTPWCATAAAATSCGLLEVFAIYNTL